MTYKVIGLMSGSSLDGLDMVFAHLIESRGKWRCDIKVADCFPYNREWKNRLRKATELSALDYCQLDADYGHFLADQVEKFIEKYDIQLQMDVIASHGHTVFHCPDKQMTAQIGEASAIAARIGVAVVSDLRNFDVALGGQGAPLVPMGEKLLFPEYQLFLNVGGIANISFHDEEEVKGYDVCPANRVLNALAEKEGKAYDEEGQLAQTGRVNKDLLTELNRQPYYEAPFPKSLGNEFGIDTLLPIIEKYELPTADSLRTYVEHIAVQLEKNIALLLENKNPLTNEYGLLATGGGALNAFLIKTLQSKLHPYGVDIVIPEKEIVEFKEGMIIALLGALRWRENNTTLPSVTGASRASVGGALWMGQEGW